MRIPELLTAIAAILAALAWPLVILAIFLVYRKIIGDVLSKIPTMFDRVKNLKVGALEAELEKVALSSTVDSSNRGVTSEQIHIAAKIESQVSEFGFEELLKQMDRLCLEYDSIRRTMPSGYERTSAMTDILIKMRALSPAVSSKIMAYKISGSPGSRLAAIAMMQMDPSLGDIKWLEERFHSENPFIFYHAALALKNMTIYADQDVRRDVADVAVRVRSVIEGFEYGVPDPDTIEVLSSIHNV